jgi:hypothetical protein
MAENSETKQFDDKPVRQYFKTYLKFINNSIGSNAYRNFYVKTLSKGEFDALDDGDNSCAFFVSAVAVIFKKLGGIHGTVEGVVKDLQNSGWHLVGVPQPGDIIVWEARQFADGTKEHIGFAIGNGKAISTSASHKTPVEHELNFGAEQRKITHIFHTSWQ